MNHRRRFLWTLTVSAVCASLGCGVRIGPIVETRTVIVHAGQPLQILENVMVTARRLGDDTQVQQDIGGWVCMPRDHFDTLAKAAGLEAISPPHALGVTP